MKKTILILFLISQFNGFGQTLTLDEVLNIAKDINNFNIILSKKGFEYYGNDNNVITYHSNLNEIQYAAPKKSYNNLIKFKIGKNNLN